MAEWRTRPRPAGDDGARASLPVDGEQVRVGLPHAAAERGDGEAFWSMKSKGYKRRSAVGFSDAYGEESDPGPGTRGGRHPPHRGRSVSTATTPPVTARCSSSPRRETGCRAGRRFARPPPRCRARWSAWLRARSTRPRRRQPGVFLWLAGKAVENAILPVGGSVVGQLPRQYTRPPGADFCRQAYGQVARAPSPAFRRLCPMDAFRLIARGCARGKGQGARLVPPSSAPRCAMRSEREVVGVWVFNMTPERPLRPGRPFPRADPHRRRRPRSGRAPVG